MRRGNEERTSKKGEIKKDRDKNLSVFIWTKKRSPRKLVYPSGLEPELDGVGGHNVIQLHYGYIKQAVFVRFSALL